MEVYMIFRIIRGAVLGVVLGLLIGVSLSGAMYMFNYMRAGINEGTSGEILADENLGDGYIETEDYVPILAINGSLNKEYIDKISTEEQDQDKTKDTFNKQSLDSADKEDEDVLGDSLVRFHVRANSNSDVDVALKYKVRDGVLASIDEGLKACTTREEALGYLENNLNEIDKVSEEILSDEGYNYAVKVYITNDYFPMRQYGEMVLPAGYYDALRIDIGLANGENFWCLLYPTMCFPMEAGGVITKEGQQAMEEALTEEQYDKLFVKQEVPQDEIEIKFKIFEILFGVD